MAKLLNCFLILSCLLTLSASAQDLRQYFKGVEGCFVLYDLKNDRYLRYNVEFLKAFYQGVCPSRNGRWTSSKRLSRWNRPIRIS